MVPVLLSQWMKEKRSPYLLLLFIGLSVLAVLLFGMNAESKLKVDVFAADGISEDEAAAWIDRLNESEAFEFVLEDEKQARNKVREGRSTVAVALMRNDFRIVAAIEDYNVQTVEQHANAVFRQELRLREAAERTDQPERFREDVAAYMERPPLFLQAANPEGDEIASYDMSMQLMFAFALFLSMFTVGFKINAVNSEKTSGIWNRMILSPTTKTEMYMGHLLYALMIGFAQILIVYLIFLYGFGFDLGDNFGMLLFVTAVFVFAVVALALLFTGFTKTPEHFNMLYPSIIPVIPLISGAYMPPGTLTNDFILLVARFFPMSHAMDALLGIVLYDESGWDLFPPVSKLLLFAVICMGVGINLVERGRK